MHNNDFCIAWATIHLRFSFLHKEFGWYYSKQIIHYRYTFLTVSLCDSIQRASIQNLWSVVLEFHHRCLNSKGSDFRLHLKFKRNFEILRPSMDGQFPRKENVRTLSFKNGNRNIMPCAARIRLEILLPFT